METYLTLEYAFTYGLSLQSARRLTEKEKKGYIPECADRMFVSVGESISLKYVNITDVAKVINRELDKTDGDFSGCGNQAYIITLDEWNSLVEFNSIQRKHKEDKIKQESIEFYTQIIQMCESNDLYTVEEAKRKAKEWNDLYNEGGEGFVPHFYTFKEYDSAKEELSKLLKESI